MPSAKMIGIFLALFFIVPGVAPCQQSVSLLPAIERQFNKIETDILTTAQAMPESKFDFTPESLGVDNANLAGVRTFSGQIMHLATDNILIWSVITGDSVRADIEDVNGPRNIKSKQDVIGYLKNSFEIGRRAISTLTSQNAMDMIQFRWRKLPRLDLAFYALTHANEHYGQMVIYLRICGLVPPPTLSDR
jgi:uncharacterized damage-inducible protein DinB